MPYLLRALEAELSCAAVALADPCAGLSPKAWSKAQGLLRRGLLVAIGLWARPRLLVEGAG